MLASIRAAIEFLKKPAPRGACQRCVHFCNDPATMEREIPGLQVMGSGWASVRKQDGICRKREVYLDATSSCADFTPRCHQAG